MTPTTASKPGITQAPVTVSPSTNQQNALTQQHGSVTPAGPEDANPPDSSDTQISTKAEVPDGIHVYFQKLTEKNPSDTCTKDGLTITFTALAFSSLASASPTVTASPSSTSAPPSALNTFKARLSDELNKTILPARTVNGAGQDTAQNFSEYAFSLSEVGMEEMRTVLGPLVTEGGLNPVDSDKLQTVLCQKSQETLSKRGKTTSVSWTKDTVDECYNEVYRPILEECRTILQGMKTKAAE